MRISNQDCTATAEVDSLPGCSQVAVVHSAFVVPSERSKRVGSKAHRDRLEKIWGELNYDAAICTVCSDNERQIGILERNGWEVVGNFLSRKTQHDVIVYFRCLTRNSLNKTYEDYLEDFE